MKIEIDIDEMDIPILKRWASICRTLTESIRLLEDHTETDEGGQIDDQVLFNIAELESIRHPMDRLHKAIQKKLWEED